jgi:hypothetical protein
MLSQPASDIGDLPGLCHSLTATGVFMTMPATPHTHRGIGGRSCIP